jgi:hypothetical protein
MSNQISNWIADLTPVGKDALPPPRANTNDYEDMAPLDLPRYPPRDPVTIHIDNRTDGTVVTPTAPFKPVPVALY